MKLLFNKSLYVLKKILTYQIHSLLIEKLLFNENFHPLGDSTTLCLSYTLQ